MNSADLLDLIKKDVVAAKESGVEAIPIENMLNYLSNINVENEDENHAIVIEGVKHQNSTQLELLKIENNFQIESFKAAINIGANACKTFLIMNGGAAIALLAFLGNIWNKSSSTESATAIAAALVLFCGGVLLAGLCAGLSYFAQCFFASSYLGSRKFHLWAGYIINGLACLSGTGSMVVFAYGSYSAYQSMIAQLVK
ncbi:hypothetical protein AAIG33_18770 [Phytobacter ursingii]|uniref:hypothetical protein n=1 Tax=Phytobacter ursingii TaxID=1972431 RepID=UPI0031B77098